MRKINIMKRLTLCVLSVFFISCGDFKEMAEGEIASRIFESIKVDKTEIVVKDINEPISFTIEADCEWNIVDVPDWLTISPMSGNGNRTISIRVNSSSDIERSATIHVKGELFSREVFIRQDAKVVFDVSPKKPVQIPKDGGTFSINVYSNTTWQIKNQSAWCHISTTNDSGNKIVPITCDRNQSNADRYDTIMVSITSIIDSTIYILVYQSKGNYYIYVADKYKEFNCDGESKTLSVQSNTNWLYRKKNQAKGFVDVRRSGDDLVLTAGRNPYAYERRDTIICEGVDFQDVSDTIYVTQKGQPPYLKIDDSESPKEISFGNAEGNKTMSVESNAEWRVNIACDDQGSWCRLLTPSTGIGIGNGSVALSIDANPIGSEQRSAIITVSTTSGSPSLTRTVILIQAPGEEPFIRVADGMSELNPKAVGDTLTFRIESNIGWRIVNAPSWCAVSPMESSLNQTVTVVSERNGNSDKRSATLSISPNPSNSKVPPVIITLNQNPLAIPGGGDNPNPHYSRKH